ncbi:MAG TPA: hypothetical protein VMW35_11830 [Myxococcota bacterium]|nr:hypothetical protein [Myxococcota bacterium]
MTDARMQGAGVEPGDASPGPESPCPTARWLRRAPVLGEIGIDVEVAFLRRREAYEESPRAVDVVETHMSFVFLTDRHAYKLKKPMRWDGLDFSTLALRRRSCEEEVRLNRRLAPGVYLGTLPLCAAPDGSLSLAGGGEPIDWLVWMRRLPADRMLDALLRRDGLREADVRPAALLLARFYADAPSVETAPDAYRARLADGVRRDELELRRPEFGLDRARVAMLGAAQRGFLESDAAVFDARVAAGRIVEGHGDLRPEHVCLTPAPVIIDCLEFSRELRLLDPADELAFLDLECERLGAPQVGRWFLDAYREVTGDAPPPRLLRFHRTYRAMRRATLAAWHVHDAKVREPASWIARARRYLELAAPPQAE